MKYDLGLVSISFRGHSPEEILQAMGRAGLTHIEWGSDVHAPCGEEETLQKLSALQREYGVTCSSYGTYFKLGSDPTEQLPQYIKAAKILGTRILRLWCGSKNSGQYTPEERERLFADCRRAAELAAEADVVFCMECHNNTYTDCKEGALELMQAVNSPHFRMYWQPNQWKTEEEDLLYAGRLAPYTLHLHVFNWSGTEKYPLQGAVDRWRRYLCALKGSHALLLEFMPDGELASLTAEAAALRRIAEE